MGANQILFGWLENRWREKKNEDFFFSFEYCDFVFLLKWRRWVFLSIFFSSHEKIVCVWLPSEWWKGEGRCDIGYP